MSFSPRTPGPAPEDINEAFWQACHGGQRRVAERLANSGADINATPGYGDQTPAEVAASLDTQRSPQDPGHPAHRRLAA
jgi:uncharacterized protein